MEAAIALIAKPAHLECTYPQAAVVGQPAVLAPAVLSDLPKPIPPSSSAKDAANSETADSQSVTPQSSDIGGLPTSLNVAREQQLQQTLAVADTLDDPLGKATLLSSIAQQYAELGQSETAAEILSQALETANTIKDKTQKRTIITTIARQYLKLEQQAQAKATVDRLDAIAAKVTLLLNLAQYYIDTEQPNQALAMLEETVALADTIADPALKAQRLAEIALAYNRIGQPQTANPLIVQSQELLDQIAVGFPFQPQPLQGTFGFSLSANIFDKSTAFLGLNTDFQKQWPVSDITFLGDIVFDYDSSRSVNQLRPGGLIVGNYRRHTSRKWQYFGNLVVQLNNGFFSSSTEDEDFSSSGLLVGGRSINLWRGKSPERFLDLQIGAGAYYLSDELRSANLSVSEVSPVLFVSLWSRRIPIGNAKIDQTLSFFTAVNLDYSPTARTLITETPQKTDCF